MSNIHPSYIHVSSSHLDVHFAPPCMNKYSLCFASMFISGIIFFNSILQKYSPFTFVFSSTIGVYQISISQQKPLFTSERLQFRRKGFTLAPLLSSFSSEHKPHRYASYRVTLNTFLSLKNGVCNVS